jgi:glutaredoxin
VLTGPDAASPYHDVVLYTAQGCSLCGRAKATLERLAVEHTEVDISGDPELEQRYREWLPVVEIDGKRAFVYHVDEQALRRKLA